MNESFINSKEFSPDVIRQVECFNKYAERIEKLIMHPNRNINSRIKQELILFIAEYNNL